jgi:hypothetical protein
MSLQINDLVLYANGIPALPEPKQRVWNLLGQGKMAMDLALQKSAMVIQQHLSGYEAMDQPAIDKAIKAYKVTYAEIVETRKKFTGFLDAAKDMCMVTEKEFDPSTNETFKEATARELQLRQRAFEKAQAETQKATEVQMFRSFIVNEFNDMVSGYRHTLDTIIHNAYKQCLSQRTPVDNVGIAITAAIAAMRDTRPKEMGKFSKTIITDAEAMKIFESITKPNWQNIFNEKIESLKAKFSLYPNDLANAEAALVKQQELFTHEQAQQAQQLEAEKATTILLAQGSVLTVTPPGMKAIVETTSIEIPSGLDWAWEIAIISAFLANANVCKDKVRTKIGGKLTTEQMAKALDAANVKVSGVRYVEIKK